MGRVLGNAATDQAMVDEGLLIARAVRLLDAPHVRVLALLSDPPKYDGDPEERATMRWWPALLASRLGWPTTSVTAVLLTLQSASCAILASAKVDGGGATYRDLMTTRQPVALEDMCCEITYFGSYLLEELSRPMNPSLGANLDLHSQLVGGRAHIDPRAPRFGKIKASTSNGSPNLAVAGTLAESARWGCCCAKDRAMHVRAS